MARPTTDPAVQRGGRVARLVGRRIGLAVATAGALLSFVTASSATVAPAAVTFAPTFGSGANSSNWAGWAHAGHHTTVTAAWRQPSVSCSSHENSDSAFWVGLDGYGSSSVEQVGTQSGCANGHAFYNAWSEFYPSPAKTLSPTVHSGDAMHATVTYLSGHSYRLMLSDSSRGWTQNLTGTASRGANASAEVVAEAPTDSKTHAVMKLSHFSGVTFSSVRIDAKSLAQVRAQQLVMGSHQHIMASTSIVSSAQSFGITWRSSAG